MQMNLKVNWDGGVFAVPDCAADGLKLASGKAVKVLLYIMRYKNDDDITERLGISEEDLEDAYSYWEQVGVLYKDGSAPAVNTIREVSAPAAEKPKVISAVPPKPAKAVSPDEIVARINESSEIKQLFDVIQSSLGRTLTFDDERTLLWIYDHLGLLPEVILMLVSYCAGIGKGNMHYIERLAVTWADEGIDDSKKADQKIRILQRNHTLGAKCISRMNLNRQLTAKESELVGKWAEGEADIELIMNAYDRTVNATGKVSFPYMNKIISEWIANGIKTPAEADAYAAQNAPKKKIQPSARAESKQRTPSAEPSFDLNAIMEHAKNTPLVSDGRSL